MTYSQRSIIEPNRALEIVVEANVTERKPHRAAAEMPFSFRFTVESWLRRQQLITVRRRQNQNVSTTSPKSWSQN